MTAIRNFFRSAVLALFFLHVFASSGVQTSYAAEAIKFASEQVVIHSARGERQLTVELAISALQREHGLMFRKSMPADHGMLFDFGTTRPVLMWMKNTPLPLDMLFLDAKGAIVSIQENAVPYSEAIINSRAPVKYVIELNGGTAAKLGLKVGDKVSSATIDRAL